MNCFKASLRTVKFQIKVFDRLRETGSILLVPVAIAFLDKPALTDFATVGLARLVAPYVISHIA